MQNMIGQKEATAGFFFPIGQGQETITISRIIEKKWNFLFGHFLYQGRRIK